MHLNTVIMVQTILFNLFLLSFDLIFISVVLILNDHKIISLLWHPDNYRDILMRVIIAFLAGQYTKKPLRAG